LFYGFLRQVLIKMHFKPGSLLLSQVWLKKARGFLGGI
jgi:hypothetical protein